MQQNEQLKIYYECDGEKPECKKIHCYKHNPPETGTCRHTFDINHAKNFYKSRNGKVFRENVQWTLNDVRKQHGLEPIPDGDVMFQDVGTGYALIDIDRLDRKKIKAECESEVSE